MTVIRSGSATDVGRVRAVNEDHALQSSTLFAVADGMGGHAGGEVASHTAIDTLEREFNRDPTPGGLAEAVQSANASVWEQSRNDPDLRGMGTTLTAAALVATDDGDRLVLANVGDSRIYRFRDGTLTQVTRDHSVAEELVDRGELSEEEAAIHPHRHILTRALGVSPDVEVDVWQLVPQAGERYLLCSDGLTNEVSTQRIIDILSSMPDPEQAAQTLVRIANDSGGNDNITAVIVDVLVDDGLAPGTDGATPSVLAATALSGQQPPPPRPATPGDSLLGRAGAAETSHRQGSRVADLVRRPSRRLTLRVVLFVIVLAGLAVGAWSLVHWYVDSSYFVKLNQGQVVIYQGRQGDFLGMKPHIVQKTGIPANRTGSFLSEVENGVEESSLRQARHFVCNIGVAENLLVKGCPTSTSSTSTTTTTASTTSTTKATG